MSKPSCKTCVHKFAVSGAIEPGVESVFCMEPRSYNFWMMDVALGLIQRPDKTLEKTLKNMTTVAPEDSCPYHQVRLEGFNAEPLNLERMQVQVRTFQALQAEKKSAQPWTYYSELPKWAQEALKVSEIRFPKRGEISENQNNQDGPSKEG